MSDTTVALTVPPTTAIDRPRVTGKVRTAIEAMVWQWMKREDAAQHAGLKDNSLYVALRRPDVKAYYLSALDVLRTSARARNIHVLEEVRDQTGNQMARVNAVKVLEQLSDEPAARSGAATTPGIVIQIINAPNPLQSQPKVIDADEWRISAVRRIGGIRRYQKRAIAMG